MADELDTNGMVVSLTDGIGPHLGRAVRSAYFELLERLLKHDLFLRLDSSARQETIDILAVAMFYSRVISPLESGESLLSLLRTAGANHIRMGRDKLTPNVASRFRGCVGAFHDMLKTRRIPVELLSFATLSDFIAKVQNARKAAEREAVD